MSDANSYNSTQISTGAFTAEDLSVLARFWQTTHPDLAVDGECGPKTLESLREAQPAPGVRNVTMTEVAPGVFLIGEDE